MFQQVMLHDEVVAVRVYADVAVLGERILHDVAENVVNVREAGDAVDDMVGLLVIHPLAIINLCVCWLG